MSDAKSTCDLCGSEVIAIGFPTGAEPLWVINIREPARRNSAGVTTKVCSQCIIEVAKLGLPIMAAP